jgi:HlyD family secretion protein
LLPGMTAHVDFIVAESQNALVVPSAALRFNPNIVNTQPRSVGGRGRPATERTHTVWRLNAAEVPEQVRIQIGLQEGNQTEVLTAEPALKVGDRILAGWLRPQSVGTRAPAAAFTGNQQRR